MKLNYTLTEEDFLQFQLFMVSQSKSLMKRRTIGKMFLLIVYGILGVVIWEKKGVVAAAFYFVVCLPLYFLYQFMESRQFISHFRKNARTYYKEQLQKSKSLDLGEDIILTSDDGVQNKFTLPSLTGIKETPSLFILMLKDAHPILIPKKNQQVDSLQAWSTSQSNALQIPYEQFLKWKWK